MRRLGREPIRLATSEVERLVQSIKVSIVQSIQCVKLYIFGSAATGKMTDESDLDFLIVVPSSSDVTFARRQIGRVPRPKDISLDLVVVSLDDFERKSEIGGVCMVAKYEGRNLLESDIR